MPASKKNFSSSFVKKPFLFLGILFAFIGLGIGIGLSFTGVGALLMPLTIGLLSLFKLSVGEVGLKIALATVCGVLFRFKQFSLIK